MLKKIIFLLIIFHSNTLFAVPKNSKILKIGSTLSFSFPNQFNKEISLSTDTQKILLVFNRNAEHIVKNFLKKQDKNYLLSHHILFVADVSSIPSVMRNIFALPSFRKSPYSILLIYNKEIAKNYKSITNSEKITIITLVNKTITKIQTLSSEKELRKAI